MTTATVAPTAPPRPWAFISHSSADDRYVAELDQFLRGCKYGDVFNDGHTIGVGTRFWPTIEDGILACDAFVVVLSHDAVKSVWVDKEVRFAQAHDKTVIAVRIDDCPLPDCLDGYRVLDFRPGRGERVKLSASRIDRHAARVLFGRETELAALDAAWANPRLNVYTFVAWGGSGKTSLVWEWVKTRFEARGWPGVERYYDWSFYSQGTGDQRQTSSDQFIQAALTFFGDPDPIKGGPWERGERLGQLVRKHRTLLILDGIEPLQYPPGDKSKQDGRLKDAALEALLKTLAADNPGLCIVTTREHLKNLEAHPTTEEQKLKMLTKDAAVALLRHLQVVGTEKQMETAWTDAGGHALTLHLLGRFLADAHGGDLRKYDEVDWGEADEERSEGRSAFRVMIAYEKWLAAGGAEKQRELAVLRLTGLFDRPMSNGCLGALREAPAIPGLTDAIVGLKPYQWKMTLDRLAGVDLLNVAADSIDAHPLIREYFADKLKREQLPAFREAHSRLFDFLCNDKNTPHRPDTLKGLEPLYEAVTHGCLAGRHEEAKSNVYEDRILRGTKRGGNFSVFTLGAIGADLAAVAAFFDRPWDKVTPNFGTADRGWLLNVSAFLLRALGRLTEALLPMRESVETAVALLDWRNAGVGASSLSELESTLGRLAEAVSDARLSINYADQSGDVGQQMIRRTSAADALHQSGERVEAGKLFADAEKMQKEQQPEFEFLYSTRGFYHRDWLLAPTECGAWRMVTLGTIAQSDSKHLLLTDVSATCDEVERRGKKMFDWRQPTDPLLDVAVDHLTLARVGLYRAMLADPLPQPALALPHVAHAVNGLRAAGTIHHLPRGLLTTSLYHFVRGEHDLAREHLDEAEQIAERGPMPLYLADVHLHRARMFRDKSELAKAAKLIRELGYGRRNDELADAEDAAKGW